MFETLLSSLNAQSGNDLHATRRRYGRRGCDRCVSVIGEKTYPVVDWSPGGLLIYGDGREFSVDGELDVVMKFRLRNDVVDVPHKARVVRKSKNKIAFEFLPLTKQIVNRFQSVVDDYVAGRFADSQLMS